MKMKLTVLTAAIVSTAGVAFAAEDTPLVINGETPIVTWTEAPEHMEYVSEIRSGWTFRAEETQALQLDDFDNPGMIFAEQGMDAWAAADGSEGKSCADCHGDLEDMAGVKPVYPKWDEAAGKVMTVQMKMNECRTERMGADAWKTDAGAALNMEAAIASVSRGMPVNVAIDGPAASTWEKGKEIYYTRFGQLELSCANCHEDNYDNMIRADHLSQGQINGFPAYRLKNAKLNGVQGRFKGCVRDTMAETFSPGSDEFIALELYVTSRANGLSVEGPSVRN